jgi:hypothetical protein
MSEKHVQLEISNHKIAVTVFVNRVNVFTNCYHQQEYKELSVNQWVTNGDNEFSTNISINPRLHEELKDQSFDLIVSLHEGSNGNFSKSTLTELHWKYEPDTHFPVNISTQCSIQLPYGNWSWFDATPLSNDTLDQRSLRQYIELLHTALDQKDYDKLAPFLTIKSTELASAYSITITERLQDQMDFFKNDLFTSPGWKMKPLQLDDLVVQYHADGKLVEILTKDGKSPLQSVALEDNVNFSLPLFLCYQNDLWILCR